MEPDITTNEGGIWDLSKLEFCRDYELGRNDHPCRHVKSGRLPFLVMGWNEAGSASVGACVQCIVEQYERMRNPSET